MSAAAATNDPGSFTQTRMVGIAASVTDNAKVVGPADRTRNVFKVELHF